MVVPVGATQQVLDNLFRGIAWHRHRTEPFNLAAHITESLGRDPDQLRWIQQQFEEKVDNWYITFSTDMEHTIMIHRQHLIEDCFIIWLRLSPGSYRRSDDLRDLARFIPALESLRELQKTRSQSVMGRRDTEMGHREDLLPRPL